MIRSITDRTYPICSNATSSYPTPRIDQENMIDASPAASSNRTCRWTPSKPPSSSQPPAGPFDPKTRLLSNRSDHWPTSCRSSRNSNEAHLTLSLSSSSSSVSTTASQTLASRLSTHQSHGDRPLLRQIQVLHRQHIHYLDPKTISFLDRGAIGFRDRSQL